MSRTESMSRRLFLRRSAAMLPAVVVATAPVAAATADDPIFAAIERHRHAFHNYPEAPRGNEPEWFVWDDEETAAFEAVIHPGPVTLAGLAALAAHGADDELIFDDRIAAVFEAIERAARSLST